MAPSEFNRRLATVLFWEDTAMGPSSALKELLTALLALFLSTSICCAQFPNPKISSGSIFGTIVFAGSNQPAQGVKVEVRLWTGDWETTTFTDRGGKFAIGKLVPGPYVVTVEELGCEPVEHRVNVGVDSKSLLLQLNRPNSERSAGVISARELSIPSRARRAFQSGVQRLARNDVSRSLPQFQRAISEFADYYEAYHLIGVANLELARPGDAEQAFRKSIELSVGRYAQPQLALGALLCDEQRFAEAERFLRAGVELDDSSWLGHYALARALFELKRLEDAERAADNVVVRKANLPEVYLLLADIHIRQRNYSAVLENIDHYLELDPNSQVSATARAIQQDARRALSQDESAKRSLTEAGLIH
jgi:Tfp pilus assembly protein PilF